MKSFRIYTINYCKLVPINENQRETALSKKPSRTCNESSQVSYVIVSVSTLICYTGVRGRLVDLCKPSARKYDLAVSVALGRNIDAIVVDSEKTCIECIEVSYRHRISFLY
jgi:chromosome segregation ATPase